MIHAIKGSSRPLGKDNGALCMALLGLGLNVLAAEGLQGAQAARDLRKTTVRLRLRRVVGELEYTDHGSAFGVDLSQYGMAQRRFLLTAAHCVLDDGQLGGGELMCELAPPKDVAIDDVDRYDGTWAKCRVVAINREHDLCLLKCAADVPVVSSLEAHGDEIGVGGEIVVVGCPSGVCPTASAGTLSEKDVAVLGGKWMAEVDFDHGNSGGPVFRKDTGQLIGIAVAGIRDQHGQFDHHVCVFVPQRIVLEFVKKSLRATG